MFAGYLFSVASRFFFSSSRSKGYRFHPQTLLATHLNGKLLTVEHGARLRLVVPVKPPLENIKAITRITYTKEPSDYWTKRGYSRYEGICIPTWDDLRP